MARRKIPLSTLKRLLEDFGKEMQKDPTVAIIRKGYVENQISREQALLQINYRLKYLAERDRIRELTLCPTQKNG